MAGSTCFATVPADQLVLGGITYGAPISAVESAYGAPDAVHEEDYIYYAAGQQGIGFKFKVKFGKVTEIKCGSLY